jgi:hypothetical protein
LVRANSIWNLRRNLFPTDRRWTCHAKPRFHQTTAQVDSSSSQQIEDTGRCSGATWTVTAAGSVLWELQTLVVSLNRSLPIFFQEISMLAPDERRTCIDRRHASVDFYSATGLNRRWKREQRSYVIDERKIYSSKTIEPDDYWKTLAGIPSEDSGE